MEKPVHTTLPDNSYLIETFGWWPWDGARNIALHLERMENSASELGLDFPVAEAIGLIDELTCETPLRCRMTLSQENGLELTSNTLSGRTTDEWRLVLAAQRVQSSNILLRHKTSHRPQFDDARAALGTQGDEALFLNERDELCEGTITNVFLDYGDGSFLTPALSCGLLPGVLRRVMLESGRAQEAVLYLSDLRSANKIFVGNSLRGLIPARWIGDSLPVIP